MTGPEIAERIRELSIMIKAASDELVTLVGPLRYAMPQDEPFRPDWRSHPGDTLAEILHESGLSQTTLAERMGIQQGALSQIIGGKRPVSPYVAVRLEAALGGPSAEFWVTRQSHYDLHAARESFAVPGESGQNNPPEGE